MKKIHFIRKKKDLYLRKSFVYLKFRMSEESKSCPSGGGGAGPLVLNIDMGEISCSECSMSLLGNVCFKEVKRPTSNYDGRSFAKAQFSSL